MISEPTLAVSIRIQFAETLAADIFRLLPAEFERFCNEWTSFLAGSGSRAGEYKGEEPAHFLHISLNFNLIAYIEPGKVY